MNYLTRVINKMSTMSENGKNGKLIQNAPLDSDIKIDKTKGLN